MAPEAAAEPEGKQERDYSLYFEPILAGTDPGDAKVAARLEDMQQAVDQVKVEGGLLVTFNFCTPGELDFATNAWFGGRGRGQKNASVARRWSSIN